MKQSTRIRLLALASAAAIFAAAQAFCLPAYAADNTSSPASESVAQANGGTMMNGPHGRHMTNGGNSGGMNGGHMGGTTNGNNHHGTMMNGTNHGSMTNGHGTMMNGGTMNGYGNGGGKMMNPPNGGPAAQPSPKNP